VNKEQNYLIAIVDDDSSIREATTSLLASAGFRTTSFASAQEFLDSTHLHEASCLILDVRIPGMNGLELQHQLNRDHRRVPIVFVTAHGNPEIRNEAMRAGAVAFLDKPFSAEDLMNALNSAIARAEKKDS
jgi:FixJ family two-component response regulator